MGQSTNSRSTPAGGTSLHRLFAIDPRALAALRIAIAFLLLADLGLRTLDFSVFYADSGLLPFRVALNHVAPFHALSGAYLYQAVLFAAAAILASLLLVGLYTRPVTIGSWLIFLSLDTQNAMVEIFGDDILRLVLFWCMFVPLGRVWSLDATRGAAKGERPALTPVLSFGTAGLLLQVAFVYFFSGLLKTGPDWWENGLGIPIALARDWLVTPFGARLTQEVDLELLKGLSFFVVGFEIAGPLLLFSPIATSRLRIFLVSLSWLFQIMLGLSFFLSLMPWTVSLVMLPFLPPVFWDRFEKLSPRFQIRGDPNPPMLNAVTRPFWTRVSEGLAFMFLVWITAYNVFGLRDDWKFPDSLRVAGRWVRIEQKWAMFSPVSPRQDGWYVIVGQLQNGKLVNLWWTGPTLSWEKPESISSYHRSKSWSTYEMRLTEPLFDRPEFAHIRRRYAEWHCNQWNKVHFGEESLVQLEVFFVDETTHADLSPPTPRPRSLQYLKCSDGDYRGM